MKNFIYSIGFSLLMLASCETTDQPNRSITLAGTIYNSSSNNIRLRSSEMDTSFSFDGDSFRFTFENDDSAYYTMSTGGEYTSIYLRSGDSLYVSLDADNFDESIKYSGTSAGINQYLAKKVLLESQLPSNKDLFALNEDDFLLKIDSVSQMRNELLVSSKETFNDDKFVKYESAGIQYEKINNKFKYESYHRRYAKEPDFNVSESYNKGLSGFDLNDSTLLGVKSYKKFLNTFLSINVDSRMEKDTLKYSGSISSYIQANLDELKESFKNKRIRSDLMYDFLSTYMTYIGHEAFEQHLVVFNNINSIPNRYHELNTRFMDWKKLAEGTNAPNFNYASINGDTLSMDNFTGKYVYIDIWATWCGPCLRELPALESLQEEFKNKNVTFVSVSIDNTPDPWRKMVIDKEMKGVQLYADGAWNSTIIKDYMVRGIPRFILVDTEGKLISASTERPSGGIKEILEGLESI